MILRDEILKEHSKSHTLYLTNLIGNDKSLFGELMNLFFSNEKTTSQRAAWVVSHCADANPVMITPHIPEMIENLRTKSLHDAVKRNTLRIIADINPKISEEYQGHAIDICFNFMIARQEPVAIRVHAMQIIFNLCQKEPELLNELKLLIEEQMPYAKPGFKSRGKKILKGIEKLN